MPLFAEHLPGRPVVPGALLLADLCRGAPPLPAGQARSLGEVVFRRFAVPDRTYTWREHEPGRWSLWHEGEVHASAILDATGFDPAEPFANGRGTRAEVPPGFRSPRLRPFEVYERADGVTSVRLTLRQVEQRLPYLRELSDPALFVLLETAGNLALLSLHPPGSDVLDPAINEFMFIKFGRIVVQSPAPDQPLVVCVRARRVARYLVWDADVRTDRGDRVLRCRRAVSMRALDV